jgi:hypothetical protein
MITASRKASPIQKHAHALTGVPLGALLDPAGLLNSLTSTFTDLGLDVVKANIGGKGGTFKDTFWVTTVEGSKVAEGELGAVRAALEATAAAATKPSTVVRPKLTVPGASEERQELLHTLMDTYVKNDVLSIQQSIVNRERRRRRGAWGGGGGGDGSAWCGGRGDGEAGGHAFGWRGLFAQLPGGSLQLPTRAGLAALAPCNQPALRPTD